jgi:hypothetical protein
VVTSIFWLKVTELDHSLKQKAVSLIKGYGKLETNEWEDET